MTVIHPHDSSTLFLNQLYRDVPRSHILNATTISDSIVRQYLRQDDKLMILGHGTSYGLLSRAKDSGEFDRLYINSKHVQFLRDKEIIGIWCYARRFAEKYHLKGLFTDMVISEVDEAYMCGFEASKDMLDYMMQRWTSDLARCLQRYSLSEIPQKMSELNSRKNDPLWRFNYNSFHYYE